MNTIKGLNYLKIKSFIISFKVQVLHYMFEDKLMNFIDIDII